MHPWFLLRYIPTPLTLFRIHWKPNCLIFSHLVMLITFSAFVCWFGIQKLLLFALCSAMLKYMVGLGIYEKYISVESKYNYVEVEHNWDCLIIMFFICYVCRWRRKRLNMSWDILLKNEAQIHRKSVSSSSFHDPNAIKWLTPRVKFRRVA